MQRDAHRSLFGSFSSAAAVVLGTSAIAAGCGGPLLAPTGCDAAQCATSDSGAIDAPGIDAVAVDAGSDARSDAGGDVDLHDSGRTDTDAGARDVSTPRDVSASGDGSTAIGIIPADSLPLPGTWEAAGVEGGIPSRTTICATVTSAPYNADATGARSAVSAIQAAIDACPPGQVVSIPAGMYRIDDRINLRRSITVRGAGTSMTTFRVSANEAIAVGGLGPWPPPKANPSYRAPVTGGATRGSTTIMLADTSDIAVGRMIMVDEMDDPSLVWAKSGFIGRSRASMHMVESKTSTSVTFRPPLQIDFARSPQVSWFPDLVENAGIEGINFLGTTTEPDQFITIYSAWNTWVYDCEFSAMPAKAIIVAWSGHVELRRNYMHDQANGGSNSEGFDFLADVSWSLIVDNICVAGGFPQINIGDGGAGANYSGGFGNVIAYNYAIDAFYTDPPTSSSHGKMCADISTNHSPHNQYNLVEGNYAGKFMADGYHGSGSHTTVFRNAFTGRNRWTNADHLTAIQVDRRNLHYAIVGNVLGLESMPATREYATTSGWTGSTIFRLGFPDIGNDGFDGTAPPMMIRSGDGGPRDLYVDRDNTPNGTTLIEGNWTAVTRTQDWTVPPAALPDSLYLSARPAWFGSLTWPPVDPARPVTGDPTIIPAGYRHVHGREP